MIYLYAFLIGGLICAIAQFLMDKFKLSEIQAQAILDMRLQKLTGLEREKVEAEYNELMKKIEYLESILADEQLLLGVIKDEILEISN